MIAGALSQAAGFEGPNCVNGVEAPAQAKRAGAGTVHLKIQIHIRQMPVWTSGVAQVL